MPLLGFLMLEVLEVPLSVLAAMTVNRVADKCVSPGPGIVSTASMHREDFRALERT